MQDLDTTNDRFHDQPVTENLCAKNYKTMIYAPAFSDRGNCNGHFTVDKSYPVLDRKDGRRPVDSTIKTIDDKGTELWIKEHFFNEETPSHLTYEKETWFCGEDCTLKEEDQIDIRKIAQEKQIEIDNGMPDCACTANPCTEIEVLSGLASASDEVDDYFKPKTKIRMGTTRKENELVLDATKCAAAVDKIFYNGRSADPDNIIDAIQKNLPRLRVAWDDNYLTVNEVRTKIEYSKIQTAYQGLKELTSIKTAENTIGRIIANMVKKLF